jgi:pyruvate dehydrogenase E1 component beta subunit
MYVLCPATPADAKGLLKAAIRDDNPVLFVESLRLYNDKGEVPDDEYVLPIGKADVKREGTDVTIVSYSAMVPIALQAADALAEDGVSVEVVDMRSLRPLDIDTVITSVKKTNRALIVTEGWYKFGAGAEIAAQIQEHAFDFLDHPVERITAREVPLAYARDLEAAALPSLQEVVGQVKAMVGKA